MDDDTISTVSVDDYGLIRLQALARRFVVRSRVVKDIRSRFEKIYDPKRRRHYYYDKKADKSSWVKPVFLLKKDLDEVAPTYTPQQAVLKLQRVVRKHMALLTIRLAYQQSVMKVTDEQSGQEYYLNPKTGGTMWQLPAFMGGRMDYARKEVRALPEPIESDSDESDASSLDSEAVRAKRRRRRKQPR